MRTLKPDFVAGSASRESVGQALELIPVGLGDNGLFWIKPMHADSLRVGLSSAARPAAVVLDMLKWYPLTAVTVHSASWRHEAEMTVLTYVAVVEPPGPAENESLVVVPVRRDDPIAAGAVVEHAVRHIAWLRQNEPVVAAALAGWDEALAGFEPEPFRALVLQG
jgi:hypothetical protein